MREIHHGLPQKDFVRPSTGIVEVTVCSESGLLKTPSCPGEVTLPFLEGTQPTRYCDLQDGNAAAASVLALEGMRLDSLFVRDDALLGELKMPELDLDLLPGVSPDNRRNSSPQGQPSQSRPQGSQDYGLELHQYNPLLD
jgi:penicillin-binding protein 1A